jgi:ATP-dependent DNA helicase DinG
MLTPPEALLRALDLERFVALDLETTGLEESCDIIELGLACYEAGQVRSRISTLVRPTQPVPPRILQLTGIDPRKLKKAPSPAEALPATLEAIGSSPVVAHNLAFDQGVLTRAAARAGIAWQPARPGLDTVPLARVLLPTIASHRLADVAAHLAIPLEKAHRALDDAEAAGGILLRLIALGSGLDLALLQRLCLLAHGSGDPQEALFHGLRDWVRAQGETGAWRANQPLGREPHYRAPGGPDAAPPFRAEEWFGPEGRLQASVEGFRHRPQQEEMARAVGALLADPAPEEGPLCLVAEAATGTGKSFAYLLPALLTGAARREAGGGPVVVSTHTRHLQDQLFHQDIPRLGRLLERPLEAVLLKGRGNYLCGHRLERLLDEAQERVGPADRLALMPLVTWAAITRSGDVEECTGFRAVHLGRLWSQVRSEGTACANPACRAAASRAGERAVCWGGRARQAAQGAHLIVVNHSLLLADLGVDHGVLGSFETLIVDEAHQFGRAADQHLRRSFSFQHLEGRLRGLHDPQGQGRGLFRQTRNRWNTLLPEGALREKGQRALEEAAAAGDEALAVVVAARAALAEVQRARHGESLQRNRYTHKERLRGANNPLRLLSADCRRLEPALAALLRSLATLATILEEAREEQIQPQLGELKGVGEALAGDAECFALIHGEEDDEGEAVLWVEIHPVTLESTFHRLPLEPGRRLATELWGPLKRILLTSATLTVAGRFDWLLDRLGLSALPGAPRCVAFESPFQLPRQARFLVPTWLPEASGREAEAFAQALAALVAACSERHGRGTLILFTSYALLSRCHLALLRELDQKRFPLLAQGLDGSRTELLERFRASGGSVLLGVDSFWEGVDLPGEALQLLVMTKLPFDVPGEPLIDARSERIQARGGNAFRDLSVPEAVIRFRQGFGRLIRHESDKGVFLLLDARVVRKEYGQTFLGSLPLKHQMVLREEDLHRELRAFFG